MPTTQTRLSTSGVATYTEIAISGEGHGDEHEQEQVQAQENEPCNRQHQEFERGSSTLDTMADNGIKFQRTISRHRNGMVQIGVKGNITITFMTPMPSLHATVVSWGQDRAEEQETLRCQVHGAELFADQEQQPD